MHRGSAADADRAARGRLGGSVARGMAIGTAAGLAQGLLEALYVLVFLPLAFDEPAERARFFACTALLLLGAGGVLGAIAGVAARALDVASDRLHRIGDPNGCMARNGRSAILTLVTASPLVAGAVLAFRGRRMQAMPSHGLLAALASIALIALAFVAVRSIERLWPWLGRAAVRAACAAIALIAFAAAIQVANARVLPRLYGFFHLGLVALEAIALALAAALVGARLRERFGPRVAGGRWPQVALAAIALASLRWPLKQYSFWPVLRAVAFDETCAESRVLALAAALHVAPAAVKPPEHLAPPPPPPPSLAALPAGPRLDGADFFLVTVDAMRGDRLVARTAPRLSALAETGTVFDRAYSNVPHTSFSLLTLLTGKYAFSLAALDDASLATHETLADLWKRERYKTAAFFPPSVFFIDRGRFADVEASRFRFEYVKEEFMDAPGRTDQVIAFLEDERPGQVFAWVHYFDPHEPYEPHDEPGGAGGTAVERYDGEVRFVDRAVARLVDFLATHRKHALVAFTADHGEEFGEHGGRYHGTSLYEEQVRVPLFFVEVGTEVEGARRVPARHVRGAVGLVDVGETLLALAGIPASARMRGRDLGPWLAPDPPDAETTARELTAFAEVGTKKLLASSDDRLICDVSRDYCELYDLRSDPGETRNLAGREPERAGRLEARLRGWMAAQSAFEREHASGDRERALGAIERCRLGDRGAAVEVAALLESREAATSRAAARCLLRLPDDPAIHARVRSAVEKASGDDPVLAALALRAGGGDRRETVAAALARDPLDRDEPGRNPVDDDARAEMALALDGSEGATPEDRRVAIRALARALPRLGDEDRARRVIARLGSSGRREAMAPLTTALENVRLRPDAVRSLAELSLVLHDGRALATVAARLDDEPYVTARTEEARALAALGGSFGAARARSALVRARARETEPVVRAAIDDALAALAKGGRAGR